VVNAGFGRYYGEGQLGDLNAPTANIGIRITLDQSNSPGLSYPVDPYVSEALSSVVTPRGLERNRKDAAINEWNLFIQQHLGGGTVFQLGYLGSKSDNLFTRTYINTVDPSTGQRPFPLFGLSDYIASYASSNFHALQAEVRRNFSRGLLFTANYQWSRSMDDGTVGGGETDYAQNVACQRCEKAVSSTGISWAIRAVTSPIPCSVKSLSPRTPDRSERGLRGSCSSWGELASRDRYDNPFTS
jgi:hypothetical protein